MKKIILAPAVALAFTGLVASPVAAAESMSAQSASTQKAEQKKVEAEKAEAESAANREKVDGTPTKGRRLAQASTDDVQAARARVEELQARNPRSWVTIRVSTLPEDTRAGIADAGQKGRDFTVHAMAACATIRPHGAPAEEGRKITAEQWRKVIESIAGQFLEVDNALARVTLGAVVTPDFWDESSPGDRTS